MSTELHPSRTVADIVLDHSECGMVFQRHRIDFCCRGERPVEVAARERGIDLDGLMRDLRQAVADRRDVEQTSMRDLTTAELIDHIVSTHHAYLRKTLPFLVATATKVARVHGERNSKLWELCEAVDELAESLIPHLDEEERKLFPALRAAVTTDAHVSDAELSTMLDTMQDDHRDVAALLERIRVASEDFTIPTWACGSYRMLFTELQAVERDTFTHVHLENHVLVPRFTETPAPATETISTFSIADEAAALEAVPAWTASGHSAKTLVRRPDARQVLIALRPGGKLSEHRTEHSIVVHVIRGCVQLHTPERVVELAERQLALLAAGIPHDLVALERSWVLVTIHWHESTAS